LTRNDASLEENLYLAPINGYFIMVVNMTYDAFCWEYYDDANKIAEIAVSNHVAQFGKLDARIDVDFAKELAISYALEKVYTTFDADKNDSPKLLNNYIYTVVHNQTLTELRKQSTQVAGGKGVSFDGLVGTAVEYRVKDYIRYEGRYERKEETLEELMRNVKKLSPDDRVIIGYWMEDKSTYVQRCLEEFGMEDTKNTRNVIYIRRCRALELLGQMMGGKKPNYRDIYVHLPGGKKSGEGSATPTETNLKRQRKRAATAYITRNVDYRSMAEKLYKEIVE